MRCLPAPSPGACASGNIRGHSHSARFIRALGRTSQGGWLLLRLRPLRRTGFRERTRLRRGQAGRFVERQLFGSGRHLSLSCRTWCDPECRSELFVKLRKRRRAFRKRRSPWQDKREDIRPEITEPVRPNTFGAHPFELREHIVDIVLSHRDGFRALAHSRGERISALLQPM